MPEKPVILTGRHATDGHEPRQVRKEAAISDAVCVVVIPGYHMFRLFREKLDSGCTAVFPCFLSGLRLSVSYLRISIFKDVSPLDDEGDRYVFNQSRQ